MKNKNAFTLAEVLITLSILGVVAAISIPSIVHKYKNRLTITKLQKAYSEVNQMATNIAINSGCYNQNISCTNFMQSKDYIQTSFYSIEQSKIIAKLAGFNNAKIESKNLSSKLLSGSDNYDLNAVFVTPSHNQYSFIFYNRSSGFREFCVLNAEMPGTPALIVVIITEPKKLIHIEGRDLFYLGIYDNFQVSTLSYTAFSKLCPAGTGPEGTPEKINTICSSNYSKTNYSCYAKIIQDGWKINY